MLFKSLEIVLAQAPAWRGRAVFDFLADKNTKVIAQIAPAVRVAVGDQFGLPRGENVMGKLVNVLHRLGFDEVYDTSYGADLTVIEESEELLERLASDR